MDASQLRYLEIVHSGPKHNYCIFLCAEGLRNGLKHSQTLFWVNQSRMDASQLRYLEIVHYARNKTISYFYVPKVSKMLRHTPKHHFRSYVVAWMLLNFGAPKKCIQGRNTSFASFTCRRLAKCSETLPNIFLGPML
jgi:hypothetical protein